MQGKRKTARAAGRYGLTLIEVLIAVGITALGVVATMELIRATTTTNTYNERQALAMSLADNAREMLAGLSFSEPTPTGTTATLPNIGADDNEAGMLDYDDVDDFNGWSSEVRTDLATGDPIGPVNALRQVITETVTINGNSVTRVNPELANYRQRLLVEAVDPVNLNTVATSGTTYTNRRTVRITVIVERRSPSGWNEAARLRWIKTRWKAQ
jgi:type II secretory pathway pseudopilin PulG